MTKIAHNVLTDMGLEWHFSDLSKVRLIVLLETGRMYTVEWRLDARGNLEDPSRLLHLAAYEIGVKKGSC